MAAFDGSLLQWRRAESTDFPRCSHSAVAVPKCEALSKLVKKRSFKYPNESSRKHPLKPCPSLLATWLDKYGLCACFSARTCISLGAFPADRASLRCSHPPASLRQSCLKCKAQASLFSPDTGATETVQNPDAARQDSNRSSLGPSNAVLAFGGFGGSAVESSLLCIDAGKLEAQILLS